jgi:hypothetical protein
MRTGLRKWKDKRLDAIARRRAAMVLEAERAAAEAALLPAGPPEPVPVIEAPAVAIQKIAAKVTAKPAHAKRREERSISKRPARKLRKARA